MAYTFNGNESHADAWYIPAPPVDLAPERCELCAAWLHVNGNRGQCLEPSRQRVADDGRRYHLVTLSQDGRHCDGFKRAELEAPPATDYAAQHRHRVADVRRPGREE